MAAIQATYDTLKSLRDGARTADIESRFDKALIKKLSRVEDYDRWIEEFLE
jgi:hypothetical protein